jgi:hypothetical protein
MVTEVGSSTPSIANLSTSATMGPTCPTSPAQPAPVHSFYAAGIVDRKYVAASPTTPQTQIIIGVNCWAPLALSSSSVLLSCHATTHASLKKHPYQRFSYTVTTAGSFSTAMIHTVLSRMVRNKLI